MKDKFIKTKLSKILIYKGNIDKVIGYVHSSDLFRSPKNIRSILLPIPFVTESMSAMQLLTQFIESNKGIALVVDEFGGTSGMLTIEDVTEEIVGEINDEFDDDGPQYSKLDENTYVFEAKTSLNDFLKITDGETDYFDDVKGVSDTKPTYDKMHFQFINTY